MDPVTATVVTILGKYAIDKGAELAKEAGPTAVAVAGRLFQKVVERFRREPADAKNIERFEQKPDVYAAPVADSLQEYLRDPVFAAEIKQLLAEYKAAAPANAPGTTTITQIAGDDAIQFGQVTGGSVSLSHDKREPTE